jgi:hypothetical protein
MSSSSTTFECTYASLDAIGFKFYCSIFPLTIEDEPNLPNYQNFQQQLVVSPNSIMALLQQKMDFRSIIRMLTRKELEVVLVSAGRCLFKSIESSVA